METYLFGNSNNWLNFQSALSLLTCNLCRARHGSIVSVNDTKAKDHISLHANCNCLLVAMRTKRAGTATNRLHYGADYHLLIYGVLPDYYMTKEEAMLSGWKQSKGNLADVLPGKMIGGDVFKNREFKLPHKPGRIWREADIDYIKGSRNSSRILFSNDGLIFVSYDHYQTFYEITER